MPVLTRHSLHHDVLEGISQGIEYQLGYSKHPFLSMWVIASVWQFLGKNDWVIYLFSQILMVIGFFLSLGSGNSCLGNNSMLVLSSELICVD